MVVLNQIPPGDSKQLCAKGAVGNHSSNQCICPTQVAVLLLLASGIRAGDRIQKNAQLLHPCVRLRKERVRKLVCLIQSHGLERFHSCILPCDVLGHAHGPAGNGVITLCRNERLSVPQKR